MKKVQSSSHVDEKVETQTPVSWFRQNVKVRGRRQGRRGEHYKQCTMKYPQIR